MAANLQQSGTLLDVLKKKMRQTKEEMEKYKDECEEFHKKLQGEVMRREEVSALKHRFRLGQGFPAIKSWPRPPANSRIFPVLWPFSLPTKIDMINQ